MSEETFVRSHAVTIRFDEHEDGGIAWRVDADKVIERTDSLSLVELAECGAPLSVIGIRALMKVCMDGAIYNALETASAIRVATARGRAASQSEPALIEAPKDATIN
jgi:hypothetical protein